MVGMPSDSPQALAINHILEHIRLGHFSGGHRLIEGDLAAELDIGRGSIREALRVLAGDGVVELIPHKGAIVRRLKEGDLIEIYEALSGLHWVSARTCAKRYRDRDVRKVVSSGYKRLVKVRAAEDELSWFLALGEYHRDLNGLTSNSILMKELNSLRNVHFHRELTRYLSIKNWNRYLLTYQKLTSAILEGDVKEAGNIIERHIDYIIEMLRQSEKPAIYK